MSKIPELSGHEFQKVVAEAKEPVIAEFFTRSCIPCKRISPLLQEIRRDFSAKLTVVRLDIEKHPFVAAKYDVAAVPTVLIFLNGDIKSRIVGVVAKENLLKVVQKHLLLNRMS